MKRLLTLALTLGLTALAACGRDTTRPGASGRVTLRLAAPAGVLEDDTLRVSAFAGRQRLEGPVTAVPVDGGFQVTLEVPAGPQRVIGIELARRPGTNEPAGSVYGVRYLGLSEPFDLDAGGTDSVRVTFAPFLSRILEAQTTEGRDVQIRWRGVPGAERYRLRYTINSSLGQFRPPTVRDTVVTDTLATWGIGRDVEDGSGHLLTVRPENAWGIGAFSAPVPVPLGRSSAISGRIESGGQPASDVLVKLLACPNNTDTGVEAFTDAAGAYAFSAVPAGAYRLRIFRGGCGDVYDPPLEQACFAYDGGTPVSRPDFALECTSIEALLTLTWGERPRDLDAHLFTPPIPDTAGDGSTTYEVDYTATGSATEPPYAELDVDDTSSFGPENVTIYRNFPGDYIFAVYNFSGGDTLAGSGATVRIVPPNGGVRTVTVPPVDDTNFNKRWWVVARLDGTTGQVTLIDSLAVDAPVRRAAARLEPKRGKS